MNHVCAGSFQNDLLSPQINNYSTLLRVSNCLLLVITKLTMCDSAKYKFSNNNNNQENRNLPFGIMHWGAFPFANIERETQTTRTFQTITNLFPLELIVVFLFVRVSHFAPQTTDACSDFTHWHRRIGVLHMLPYLDHCTQTVYIATSSIIWRKAVSESEFTELWGTVAQWWVRCLVSGGSQVRIPL